MIIRKDVCQLNYHYMTTISDYWSLNKKDKDIALCSGIDYLFRFSNTNEFKLKLSRLGLDKKEVLMSQRKITSKGFLTKDLKLHLLQKVLGIKPIDVGESRKLFNKLSDSQLYNIEKLAKRAIVSKDKLDELILNSLEACRPYVAKFVRKKMTFLIKTGRHQFNDMCNQFLLEGLQSLLFMYPRFESELHAINILKHNIKNIGQNYIETHTRQKRNDYSDSHTLRVDSLYLPDSNIIVSDINNSDLYSRNENEVSQLESDVSEVLEKFDGNNKLAIKLMMGEYNKEFTDYLNTKKITRFSNDLYCEQTKTDRYNYHIFKYLDIPMHKGNSLIKTLKTHLISHKQY